MPTTLRKMMRTALRVREAATPLGTCFEPKDREADFYIDCFSSLPNPP